MKSLLAVTVLALVCVAASARIQPKSIFTDIIQNIIKNHRQDFANTWVEIIDLGEHGSIQNLTITNLENFVMEKLEAPGPLSLKISNATASYDWANLDTSVYEFNDINIPELGITLTGKGLLHAHTLLGRISVALDCKIKGLSLEITDFRDFQISLGAIEDLVLEGIDQADADAVAAWIPGYIEANYRPFVEEHKQDILDLLNYLIAKFTS